MYVAFVLFLCVLVCPAQVSVRIPAGREMGSTTPAVAPPSPRREELCTLEGQVFSDATGAPLKKASVVVTRIDVTVPQTYTTASDSAGKFAMKDLDPGKYRLTVMRSGFVTAKYGSRSPARPGTILTLDPGQHVNGVKFRLIPHGVVAGHIVDEDGEAVPYVSVELLRFQYKQGKRELANAGIAATDDLGNFRVFGVPPGKYYLRATPSSGLTIGGGGVDRSAPAQPNDDYVATYYPGTTDATNALPIAVAAGTVIGGINLALSKNATVHVRGSVITSTGNIPGPIQLFLLPLNGQWLSGIRNVTDATGHFDLRGITPGQYSLQAALDDDNRNYSGQIAITVGNTNLDDITLTLNQGMNISGVLRIDDDTPHDLSGVEVRLQQKEAGIIVGGLALARLKQDGTFQFQNVGADICDVIVRGLPDGFYIKSVKSGETDVMRTGLDMTKGVPPSLEIVVSPRAGMINGSVQNPTTGQPAPGASVVLVPQEKERRSVQTFYFTTATDQNGFYTLKNLTPGEYKLFAWEDLEPGAYMDPDFLTSVEGKGEAMTIREGDRKAISIMMTLADTIDVSNKALEFPKN